jgi:hypothetical protein
MCDPHPNARSRLLPQHGLDSPVLREKQAAIYKDADVMLGAVEEPPPHVGRNSTALRVRHPHLIGRLLRGLQHIDAGPQVARRPAGELDQFGPVTWVWKASAQPALDRLRVDAEPGRNLDGVQADSA